MKPTHRAGLAALSLAFFSTGCIHLYHHEAERARPAAGQAAAGQKPDEKGPFKPMEEVLKDTRKIDGFFTMHLKRDNTLFLEVRPDQLDHDFGMVLHYSRGVGDFNVHDGLPVTDMQMMRLRRVGDALHLVRMNPRFTATAGSPMRYALDDNLGHSIVDVFKIESEAKDSKNLVVNVTGFFASDYGQVSDQLKFYYGGKPVTPDKEKSFVSGVLGFPRNVEVDATVSFKAGDYPRFGGDAVSDYRSIPIGIRYSILALPEQPMRPRYGDDRVGHFLDAVWDFSRDQKTTPFVRYVNRWRLEKKDPSAERSEPVQPIVFYVDRSVPVEYRRWVKEGVEGWSKAFEAAGFINAIVALDAPDDPNWSAEDARYSTVRWTPGYQMGYAIGPSQTDPRTGEILNADILISSSWITSYLSQWQRWAGPDALIEEYRRTQQLAMSLEPEKRARLCTAALGASQEMGLQYAALLDLGVVAPGEPMPEEFWGPALRDLVLHEVGHTLGLRHNFKASSGIPQGRLHDEEFTRQNGTSLSVMDYAAVNIAVDPREQGHYWNMEVGAYDVWVIKYAYAPVYEQSPDAPFAYSGSLAQSSDAELVGLAKIAREASEPLHTYGTDEDNWRGAYAVDPLTNARDLGSDPLAFARDRHALIARLQPTLERRLIADGDGFQLLRGAFSGIMFERYRTLSNAIKHVGGIYHARDHLGDPRGRLPFTPVPAARQRETVALVVDAAFAEGSFRFQPEFLNKLAPNRYAHWGTWDASFGGVIDYPIHAQVAGMQNALLEELLHPVRLTRMIDNGVRVPANADAYTVAELLRTVSDAAWSELGTAPRAPRNVDSFRRNLQRAHLEQMIDLMLDRRSPFAPESAPEDARSLARFELAQLSDRLGRSGGAAGLDAATRAHFAESKARIDRALEASLTLD